LTPTRALSGADGPIDQASDRSERLRSGWFLHIGIWTLLGLSFAAQNYFSSMAFGTSVPLSRIVRSALCDWYILGILFYPVRWVSARFPLDRHLLARHVGFHLLCGALFSVAHIVLYILIQGALNPQAFAFQESFTFWFIRRFHGNLFYYATFVMISHGLEYYGRLRERELKASELEARLAQAQLQALKMQLQPHFLFNTLHTISELVHENAEAADQTITRLSDLLRMTLKNPSAHEVPLKQELDFLERYLELERTRLGDRLAVQMEVPPETLDSLVPNLILQPLVENAIRHGIAPCSRPGEIGIRIERHRDELKLQVRNTNQGTAEPLQSRSGNGVGLANTQARLHRLYGDRQNFTVRPNAEGNFVVEISIPFRTAGEEQAQDHAFRS
jgi:two-component system, LytTR family, sensor kinase